MKLVTKQQAPKCCYCGQPLWHIHWERANKALRLGWVKKHRQTPDGKACWNRVACAARRNDAKGAK